MAIDGILTSADASTSNATSTFGQFPFQSKQRKEDLLRPYGAYFEEFKSQLPTPLGIRLPPLPPDFRIANPWEASKSEEEKESEDQKFTYQNPIPENLEVKTPNIQTPKNSNQENLETKTPNIQILQNQNILNPDSINQLNLLPNIAINHLPIEPIIEPIQPLQLPQQPQQPLLPPQQQLQPPIQQQQPNVDPIAYAPIAKLNNFTGKENDTQVWLNNIEKAITANRWNDARALRAIPYFLKDTANS
ncbi:hypothetical protein G9A89_017105 [Geosiphon pyriformis]|nr:hypothetical protein G9A89_017105 [Geosiphon pyriformis]